MFFELLYFQTFCISLFLYNVTWWFGIKITTIPILVVKNYKLSEIDRPFPISSASGLVLNHLPNNKADFLLWCILKTTLKPIHPSITSTLITSVASWQISDWKYFSFYNNQSLMWQIRILLFYDVKCIYS